MDTRRDARLSDWDYRTNGAYFVTFCTKDRANLLCLPQAVLTESVGADTIRPSCTLSLSAAGLLVEQGINNIPKIYPGVRIEKYAIMPNHVHILLVLTGGRMVSAPTLSVVIAGLKRWTSTKAGQALWQKSFYDHIIRDENDFYTKWNYIDTNPLKWASDRYYN